YAGQIDTALLKLFERPHRIVVAQDADQSRARRPHGCAKRVVQQRAARLTHTRRSVGKHHIVNEEVAQQHDRRNHSSRLRSANAAVSARTASRSSGLHQTPPCLTDEPTMNPWAVENRARFAGVTPDPTSTGPLAAWTTSRTSSGEAGSPVVGPVTTTPSARKNSAAFAVSTSETSAVIACALCFFLTSAKISTRSAPIVRR